MRMRTKMGNKEKRHEASVFAVVNDILFSTLRMCRISVEERLQVSSAGYLL